MEGGSGNDNTDDSSVLPDDAVDLDLTVTPRPAMMPRFHPKIKGKAKVTDSSHDPKLEAVVKLSQRFDSTEQAVEDSMEDDIVREISVFCGSGNLGEDTQRMKYRDCFGGLRNCTAARQMRFLFLVLIYWCSCRWSGPRISLYVMQHVLREAWRPYELNKRCEEIRMNPKQLKIEVDLRMEMDDVNYDQEKSKPLKLQKQTLSSSVVSPGIQYAVGFLEKNRFHLNPVHAILQLRPSLASFKNDLPKKKFVSNTAEASTKAIEEKVASKNSDESKIDDEPWILLQYHPIDSSISNKNKHKMAAEVVGNVQFMMRPSDYLHFLPSGNLDDKTVSGAPSMRILHRMPLEERLRKWFCETNQVSSFDALKHLARGYSEDDLLKVLPSYANLVQGLWVCKSSLLYSGVEAIQRDYILLLFSKRDTIQYHKLREINLNPRLQKYTMDALAYNRESLRDWKFKQSTDLSFIKSYPNIVREQENAWLGHEKIILDSIEKVGKKISIKTRVSLASDIVKTTTAHKAESPFTNSDKDVIESLAGQSMSSETHEHLPRALLEIFNDKKVHSLQSIVRGLREMALYKSSRPKEDPKTRLLVNAAANAVSAPGKELCSVIDQVAVCIHGLYVLKSAGNPALDPLRNVVINLYRGKEPNAKLRKQEIKQAAQLSLKRDISDSEYNQVIHELCISRKGAWELKSGE